MIWWWPWIHWIIEKAREVQKNTYFCFIDYAKAFDCVDHDKLQKILKEMGIPNFTCVLRNLYAGQETTVRTIHGKKKKEPYMKQWTGSRLGKEYIKTVYCHSVYSTYMQSTSCKMLGWNQDCREKYHWPQICRWHHPYGRKWRGTKEPLDESEKGEWKTWLKTQHSKQLRSWHLVPSLHGK